ncbi:glucose-1-phosphate thymidylyltransferase RfbA [Flavobacteriaceae bacterium]|uniref:glucose-1-phosphate thymidylyltransferase RfbA n=1 Tax=Candidatus Arcticimaribacter forsetii TaxID=2820661 RepID=UPI0020773965|nr:glucose-1-phosphate thymidylyltransferase RfbA [Candidatus Arcticimaribacter forsetii]MCH1538565.1 glucose-1-phosphate thymidylyltransferase RfbA [Flavobacteriaceae bacterium]MDA8698634.1 glucose-1-phosphate thymidylyltransferase RfbA [Flavobacteriaceae bacterium]MDB2325885.1 glucose-1-phosphate thymidylyltransferase RfbA [Flavobacteriaceae bacterium]MDB2329896.1 glucose-1-phosphate thymidylyltransferase RfbA [Flavobacteriaceae bacterium]MDB2346132.1 glucose-1-phosphate thymidylyltransferas
MKGIILAGGKGTRLYPLTQSVSKQLMPIYDKPMIYYPLATLIEAGIHEILIITTPEDLTLFKNLLGDGSRVGCKFSYVSQPEANGIAQAFILGEKFIQNDPVALILGDNLFYGTNFIQQLKKYSSTDGGMIFASKVTDPERYGIVLFDENQKAVEIEEKPKNPKSSYAVPGIYFYDETVVDKAKQLKPSKRGELEITDLNQLYMNEQRLHVEVLDPAIAWLDTGTVQSLMDASQFVQVIQSRQGILIGSIEAAAYKSGAIDKEQLSELATELEKTVYGTFLKSLI